MHLSSKYYNYDVIRCYKEKKTLCGWTNPKSVWQNDASSFRLIGCLKCVSLTPVAFQFKSRGQGFRVTLGFGSLKLDRTGWDKWTQAASGAVNTCLSFLRFKDKRFTSVARRPELWARLITNQFHLDGSQNQSDPAGPELLLRGREIGVEWLVCTTCYLRNYMPINSR